MTDVVPVNYATMTRPYDEEAFWARVNKAGGFPDFTDPLVRVTEVDGECWTWTGPLNGEGYGQASKFFTTTQAHRISYRLAGHPLALNRVIDHLCRRRACVNPAHLEQVTTEENIRRGLAVATNRKKGEDGVMGTYAVSVGQLVAMKPEARAVAISHLGVESRLRLAHLASLGIVRELKRLSEYQEVLEALTHEEVQS